MRSSLEICLMQVSNNEPPSPIWVIKMTLDLFRSTVAHTRGVWWWVSPCDGDLGSGRSPVPKNESRPRAAASLPGIIWICEPRLDVAPLRTSVVVPTDVMLGDGRRPVFFLVSHLGDTKKICCWSWTVSRSTTKLLLQAKAIGGSSWRLRKLDVTSRLSERCCGLALFFSECLPKKKLTAILFWFWCFVSNKTSETKIKIVVCFFFGCIPTQKRVTGTFREPGVRFETSVLFTFGKSESSTELLVLLKWCFLWKRHFNKSRSSCRTYGFLNCVFSLKTHNSEKSWDSIESQLFWNRGFRRKPPISWFWSFCKTPESWNRGFSWKPPISWFGDFREIAESWNRLVFLKPPIRRFHTFRRNVWNLPKVDFSWKSQLFCRSGNSIYDLLCVTKVVDRESPIDKTIFLWRCCCVGNNIVTKKWFFRHQLWEVGVYLWKYGWGGYLPGHYWHP